jgi:hypothetical protein
MERAEAQPTEQKERKEEKTKARISNYAFSSMHKYEEEELRSMHWINAFNKVKKTSPDSPILLQLFLMRITPVSLFVLLSPFLYLFSL